VKATLAVAALGVTMTACQPKATEGWRSELVSINGAGTAAGNSASQDPVFSPDGTEIAFVSWSTDLGPGDSNFFSDVYLRDLTTGEVTLISANGAGTSGGNEDSFGPVFSPDGTRIAFESRANDLGPTDQDRGARDEDVYVRDLATGTTSLVSVDGAGTGSGTWPSVDPVFDPTDSDRLVFTSGADNLQGSDPDGNVDDLYLRDLATGTTTLLSNEFTPSIGGDATNAAFSADGRMLTFESSANLVPDFVRTSSRNAYVRDMQTGEFTAVSWNAEHTAGPDDWAEDPAISADGTLVAYTSYATDIAEDDSDVSTFQRDIFVYDLTSGTTALGSPGEKFHADLATFSPDGAWLAYTSGLVGLDRVSGELQVTAHPEPEDGFEGPAFSPASDKVLFRSWARLDPRDQNIVADVYLLDIATGEVELVSANDAQTGSGNDISGPYVFPSTFSPDGTRIAFESRADDLSAVPDPQEFSELDVFVARFVDPFAETDLSVTSAANPTTVPTGANLTHQVTVTNEGPTPAENVSIALGKAAQLRPGTITVTQGTCGDFGGDQRGTLTCEVGTLQPGGSAQLTVVVRVLAPTGTTLESGVVVDMGPTLDPNGDNNAALTTVVVG
jgi:Tol biopolymer transport system component